MAFLPTANLLVQNIYRRARVVKHHHLTANGEDEFLDFSIARAVQGVGNLRDWHPHLSRKRREPLADCIRCRWLKINANLKSPPNSSIQQLRVISRANQNCVGGQVVDLHQQRTHNSLDFTGLVLVATLFPDGIELVEEENAGGGARKIEDSL